MHSAVADYQQLSIDYSRVETALQIIEERYSDQPGLHEIAAIMGLSESHFQRLFTRWVGISPKRFLQFLTKEHAKQILERSENLLEATYQTGMSSPGRLHDLFVSCEAVTPGQYKSRGQDMTIWFGFHPTPFGECLIALTERGVCGLSFLTGVNKRQALQNLQNRWTMASLVEAPERSADLVGQIFPLKPEQMTKPLPVFLSGTNFQIKVWEALIRIPYGYLTTYEDIAVHLGDPGAARAVGQAVANNSVAVLIPCHRVIRKMGVFGGYRWGLARKMALHGWEMSRSAV